MNCLVARSYLEAEEATGLCSLVGEGVGRKHQLPGIAVEVVVGSQRAALVSGIGPVAARRQAH